jgi:hypothetical protein
MRTFLISILVTLASFNCTATTKNYPDTVRESIKSHGGIHEFLKYSAKSISKDLPKKLDERTLLISVIASENRLMYIGKLADIDERTITPAAVDDLKKKMLNGGAEAVCSSPTSKISISDFGVSYEYSFYSQNNKWLFRYAIDKSVCQFY